MASQPTKTNAVDDRKIIRAVKKNPETTVIDITNNLQSAWGESITSCCLQKASTAELQR